MTSHADKVISENSLNPGIHLVNNWKFMSNLTSTIQSYFSHNVRAAMLVSQTNPLNSFQM